MHGGHFRSIKELSSCTTGGSWPKFGWCHFLRKISEFSFILFQQPLFAIAIRFLNWEKSEEDICNIQKWHFFINFPFTSINIWDILSGWLKFPFWCLHFCWSWKNKFPGEPKNVLAIDPVRHSSLGIYLPEMFFVLMACAHFLWKLPLCGWTTVIKENDREQNQPQ